jgi:RHS repeat-associated protein
MKFTGHERDLASAGGAGDDLDYMHARHCSPLVGRFLSVDPVGGNLRNPQAWNRYTYALNNPLKFIDPAGLAPASQQGRNALQRAIDEVSLFFQALLNDLLNQDPEETEDPLAETQNPDSMSAQLAAEGIDPSLLPENQAAQFKDAFIEANATVAAGVVVAVLQWPSKRWSVVSLES